MLLIRSENPRRHQAENPLKLLSEFAGPALSIACAEIEISGVAFVVNGLEVRRGYDGGLQIDAMGHSHNGVIVPVIELPSEIENAIGREITGLLK